MATQQPSSSLKRGNVMQSFVQWKTTCTLVVIVTILCLPQTMRPKATGGAQVSGAITDQSSAVVPNAQVRVTQTDTGQVRTTVSSANGSYSFPNLPVGPYTVEV